jgi:phosphate transport system substrate-binding protein
MSKLIFFYISIFFSVLLFSCKTKSDAPQSVDTHSQDSLFVSIDESFRPVMEQQIAMFESSYPGKHIIASYKSEVECLKDFINSNHTPLVIVGKGLSSEEERKFASATQNRLSWNCIASDAVVLVANAASVDTLFDLDALRNQLSGKIKSDKKFVFDGMNATSTVRYVRDSILKGESFDTSLVKAKKNSREVLDYVVSNKNAIGFVGMSWIGNPENMDQVKLLQKIKLCYVRCDLCDGKPYVKPMQQTVASKRYPLVRPLCFLSKEGYPGLGGEFISFLKYERGQLIFRRSYLEPVMDFSIRNVNVNQRIPKN